MCKKEGKGEAVALSSLAGKGKGGRERGGGETRLPAETVAKGAEGAIDGKGTRGSLKKGGIAGKHREFASSIPSPQKREIWTNVHKLPVRSRPVRLKWNSYYS